MPNNKGREGARLKKNQAGKVENVVIFDELAALDTPSVSADGTEKTPTFAKAEEGLTFNYTAGGVTYTFRMPNESASAINVGEPKPYVGKAGALIESARAVRQQKLFGEIDVEKLAQGYPFSPYKYQIENVKTMLNRFEGNGVFGDQVGLGKTVQALMTAHAMFASGAIRNALIVVPQKTKQGWIDEINDKFPGIFLPDNCGSDDEEENAEGDGKKDKPKKKTPTFLDVLNQIEKDNADPKKNGNRVYIITEGMLASNLESIARVEKAELFNEELSDELVEWEETLFQKIEREILGLENWDGKVEAVFKKYGWKADAWYPLVIEQGKEREAFFLYAMSYRKYERLADVLRSRIDQLEEALERDLGARRSKDETKAVLDEVEAELSKMKGFAKISSEEQVYLKLLSNGSERLVDLLIVDEVHSFYGKSNEETGRDDSDESKVNSAVDLLAKLGKKYCILMSATPVRTCLENVFDLIYIADRARVGEDRVAGLDYFHNTICQLPKTVKRFLISEMIYNPVSRKNFFGMINNFFTRKRIRDVAEQMKGMDDKKYEELMDEKTGIPVLIKAEEAEILKARTLMYMQSGDSKKKAEEKALQAFEEWKRGSFKSEPSHRHWNAALDKVLMAKASKKGASSEIRKKAHARVDWRRRHKYGIAVVIDDSVCEQVSDRSGDAHYLDYDRGALHDDFDQLEASLKKSNRKNDKATCEELLALLKRARDEINSLTTHGSGSFKATERVWELFKKLKTAKAEKKIDVPDKFMNGKERLFDGLRDAVYLKKAVYCAEKMLCCIDDENLATDVFWELQSVLRNANEDWEIHDILKNKVLMNCEGTTARACRSEVMRRLGDFRNSVRKDAVIVYVSRVNIGSEAVKEKIAERISAAYKERGIFVAKSDGKKKGESVPPVVEGNYNQIALLHQGFQAGVNLQQYRTFVFAQLDFKGQRLLEPVDIEQWVGRIHRTGQVKNCRIVTILKTYMKEENRNPELEFLKWYYEILSDPEGLDLYGDHTPDVAFLQPVIVDRLRWFFATKVDKNFFKKVANKSKLQKAPALPPDGEDYTLNEYSFSELLEICYLFDKELGNDRMKEAAKEMIRALCRLEGFGGKNAALQ